MNGVWTVIVMDNDGQFSYRGFGVPGLPYFDNLEQKAIDDMQEGRISDYRCVSIGEEVDVASFLHSNPDARAYLIPYDLDLVVRSL